MIPLILKLKRARHKEIAKIQDMIVEELYKQFGKAVLHGGTAIWRCYKGNRFSEDIDTYLPRDTEKINAFFAGLERKGFSVQKKKVSQNSIFSLLSWERTEVRFEAVFEHEEGVLKEYETADGNFITVYTLSPERLLKEKTSAYLKRWKIRDLYDTFFLLRYVKDREMVLKHLKALLQEFRKPVDEPELKVLIIEGLVPDTGKMLNYIKDWLR